MKIQVDDLVMIPNGLPGKVVKVAFEFGYHAATFIHSCGAVGWCPVKYLVKADLKNVGDSQLMQLPLIKEVNNVENQNR